MHVDIWTGTYVCANTHSHLYTCSHTLACSYSDPYASILTSTQIGDLCSHTPLPGSLSLVVQSEFQHDGRGWAGGCLGYSTDGGNKERGRGCGQTENRLIQRSVGSPRAGLLLWGLRAGKPQLGDAESACVGVEWFAGRWASPS